MEKVNQSKKKLLNSLDHFVDSDYFQDGVLELRKKLKISKNGHKITKDVREAFEMYAFPVEFGISLDSQEYQDIIKDLAKITDKFPIRDRSLELFFFAYLFYNEEIYEILDGIIGTDLCGIVDMETYYEDTYSFLSDEETGAEIAQDLLKEEFRDYPVAIKLNPNVSQRDLIDYIETNWRHINRKLSHYKIKESKLNKTKARDSVVKERNDFIYKRRNMPVEDLCKMVNEKFHKDFGYQDIYKLISEERKRRREV